MRLSPSIVLLRTQTDERLVALAAEGSEPAFEALVERYRRLVLRACMRVLPESRAEDATQQVFLAAWKALRRGDEVRAVRPWLLRISRNTALNALRTPGYEYDELAESLSGGIAPQAELEQRDVMRRTLRGLAALPENQREALLRTAVQGASHADIARDLGISEGATRQLVLRARTTLRQAVSAITPLPLLHWASNGSSPAIAEVAAGGSTAGAALLAKAGAVVVLAGGAAATPAIVRSVEHDKPEAAAAAARPGKSGLPAATTTPFAALATAEPTVATLHRERVRESGKPAKAIVRRAQARAHARGRGHAQPPTADDGTGTSHGNGSEHGRQTSSEAKAKTKTKVESTAKGKGHAKVNHAGGNGKQHSQSHADPVKPAKPAKPVKPVKDKVKSKPVATPTPEPTVATPTPTPSPEKADHGHHGHDDD